MADIASDPLQLTADFTTQEYQSFVAVAPITNITGNTTVVTTINGGGGGQATGPTITFTSNWSGVNFTASSGVISLDVLNPTSARGAISAAKSGVNTDITQLNGASQVDVSGEYKVNGTQVVTSQQPAIPDSVDPTTNAILAALRVHGLIAT